MGLRSLETGSHIVSISLLHGCTVLRAVLPSSWAQQAEKLQGKWHASEHTVVALTQRAQDMVRNLSWFSIYISFSLHFSYSTRGPSRQCKPCHIDWLNPAWACCRKTHPKSPASAAQAAITLSLLKGVLYQGRSSGRGDYFAGFVAVAAWALKLYVQLQRLRRLAISTRDSSIAHLCASRMDQMDFEWVERPSSRSSQEFDTHEDDADSLGVISLEDSASDGCGTPSAAAAAVITALEDAGPLDQLQVGVLRSLRCAAATSGACCNHLGWHVSPVEPATVARPLTPALLVPCFCRT
jgi:hypothetical protein